VVGSPLFTFLGTYSYLPFDAANTAEAAASKMTVTAAAGIIATGVDAIRFVAQDPGVNNGNIAVDGTVFFEFDVLGTPVVAQPPGLAIATQSGNVVVSFTGVLQSSASLNGPFADVPDYPDSPLVLPPSSLANMMFFRARQP